MKIKKYKVELIEKQTYVIDVLADNESDARKLAQETFEKIMADNMEHYYAMGDDFLEQGTIYDVTNTDDPFDPLPDHVHEWIDMPDGTKWCKACEASMDSSGGIIN